MGSWWIEFTNRKPACVYGTEQEARDLGAAAGVVTHIRPLPYPASPRLDDRAGWNEGQCPSFCHQPAKCVGRSACPASHSCVD